MFDGELDKTFAIFTLLILSVRVQFVRINFDENVIFSWDHKFLSLSMFTNECLSCWVGGLRSKVIIIELARWLHMNENVTVKTGSGSLNNDPTIAFSFG